MDRTDLVWKRSPDMKHAVAADDHDDGDDNKAVMPALTITNHHRIKVP